MQPTIKAVHYKLIFIILAISETFFVFFCEWKGDKNYKEGLAFSLMFVFLFAIFILLIEKNQAKVFNQNIKVLMLYIGIFASVILVSLSRMLPIQHLWMIGCLVLAAAYNVYIGVMSTALFLCLDGICCGYTPEQFVFYGVLGIILCQLITFFPSEKKALKLIQTYIYYIIISESCYVTLFLVTNSLDYFKLSDFETIIGIIYTGIIVTVIFLVMLITKQTINDSTELPEVIDDAMDAVLDEQAELVNHTDNVTDENQGILNNLDEVLNDNNNDAYTDISKLLDPDYELLVRLSKENPSVYKHCKLVCKISRQAAESINADSNLAAAGGMYHEIGKLSNNKNYIENNIMLADEYAFPVKLKEILIEHNIKSEIPHSKESAVVYFTDSILSTINYLLNVKKVTNVPSSSIIESFFKKRLEDSNLDESGLTIRDFKLLKKYYINYFNEESD